MDSPGNIDIQNMNEQTCRNLPCIRRSDPTTLKIGYQTIDVRWTLGFENSRTEFKN